MVSHIPPGLGDWVMLFEMFFGMFDEGEPRDGGHH